MSRPALLPQLLKFGLVGLLATAVHAATYLIAVLKDVAPLAANAGGFCMAFLFSFVGHWRWTFIQSAMPARRAFAKFLLTSLIGFASNGVLTWVSTDALHLPSASALVGILFVTPLLVFFLAKHWAFAAVTAGAGSAGNR